MSGMKIEGYGCDFEAYYIGGPADGLVAAVVVINESQPPVFSCLEINNLIEPNTPLGAHFFKKRPANDTRVGVYMLEKDPNDYGDDDSLTYHFLETMNYAEYLDKYDGK